MAIEDVAQLQRALAMHDMDVPLRLRRYAPQPLERAGRVQARSQQRAHLHATGLVRWARPVPAPAGRALLDVALACTGATARMQAL